MAFVVPEGLAPELHPLAWLIGSWRGPGFLAYPQISERPFVQDVTFAHDGGPYLVYSSTIRLLEEETDGAGLDREAGLGEAALRSEGAPGGGEAPQSTEVRYTPGPVWATESGYWRPTASPEGGVRTATSAGGEPETDVEVMLAEPSGHVSVYLGTVKGPRVEIATDVIARTSTAAEVNAVHRMYGLVGGELMWALDMAAFGHELRPYASARLTRRGGNEEGGLEA